MPSNLTPHPPLSRTHSLAPSPAPSGHPLPKGEEKGRGKRPEGATDFRHEVKRKIIHYAALIFPLAYAAVAQKVWVLAPIGIGILVIAALEILRKKDERLNEKLLRFFGGIHRPEEAHKTSALIYTFSGSFLTILIFPKPIAILALLYLVFGDGSAALVGKVWGRTPVFGKSLEGMLANLLTCWIVGTFAFAIGFLPLKISAILVGAAAAALVEVMPFPMNDNLGVPILSGLVMTLCQL